MNIDDVFMSIVKFNYFLLLDRKVKRFIFILLIFDFGR